MRKFKEKLEFGRSKHIVIFAGELGYSWRDYENKNPKLMGILEYLRKDFIWGKEDQLLFIFDDQIEGIHDSYLPHAMTYNFSNKKTIFNQGIKIEREYLGAHTKWKETCCVYQKWAEGITFPYATIDPNEITCKKRVCYEE